MEQKQKAVIVPEKIHIESIRVTKGNINCPEDFDQDKIFAFKSFYDLKNGVNIEDKALRFVFTAEFVAINDKNEPVGLTAEYTIEFYFTVENLDEFIESKEGDEDPTELAIDGDLGTTLAGIVYSTARGIILSRTQGTIISNGIIISVVNPEDLLDK